MGESRKGEKYPTLLFFHGTKGSILKREREERVREREREWESDGDVIMLQGCRIRSFSYHFHSDSYFAFTSHTTVHHFLTDFDTTFNHYAHWYHFDSTFAWLSQFILLCRLVFLSWRFSLIWLPVSQDMGFSLPMLKHLMQTLPINVLVISYRGYGESEGKPDEEGLLIDAEVTTTWLSQDHQRDDHLTTTWRPHESQWPPLTNTQPYHNTYDHLNDYPAFPLTLP